MVVGRNQSFRTPCGSLSVAIHLLTMGTPHYWMAHAEDCLKRLF
jgi:hypothetical protein